MRRNGFEKYLLYRELLSVAERATDDSVIVVYQHLQKDANKRAADVQRRLGELTVQLRTTFVWALQWSDLAFLVSVREPLAATRIAVALQTHAERHRLMLVQAAEATSAGL